MSTGRAGRPASASCGDPGGPLPRPGSAGDVITSVAGRQVSSTQQLATVLAGLDVGQTVPVGITSQQGERTVQVTLGQLGGS